MTDESFRLLELWIKAIENDFASAEAWTRWAYQQIESSTVPEGWIIDLATASTKSAALEELYRARANVTSIRWLDESRFAIGLFYLRYLEGQLPLDEVLRQAGNISDTANVDSPSCESYFTILTLLELDSAERAHRQEIEEAARQLLEPHARFVKSELAKLPLNKERS